MNHRVRRTLPSADRLAAAALVVLAALAFASIGCDSQTIQNLGGIEAAAQLYADGIRVEVFLTTDTGNRLYWESSILSSVGMSPLPSSELDTRVSVWSLKSGQRHKEIYLGRLRDLHWNIAYVDSYRSLLGIVPYHAINADQEADSVLGEMDIALVTPKQGVFRTTIGNVQVYPTGYVVPSSPSRED
ncbi:hypothetical protein FJZ36_03330 [Candidatus Poribacteria bacterium]|nr:hypothetical protein [Candidatus Poribacteria bacterium]